MSASKQLMQHECSVARTSATKQYFNENLSEDSGLEDIIDVEIDRLKNQKYEEVL